MSAPSRVRCLVVDDEPFGRARVAALLAQLPEADVVGVCADGAEALEAIASSAPDVLFLDVEMPEIDGFGVLAALPAARRPAVVFVTAHDRYAVRAFDVHAQDYLLKPFDPERLYEAFHRAASRVRHAAPDDGMASLLAEVERARPRRTRIAVRTDGRIVLLPVADIDWIESDDNHVRIHARGATHVVRQTLQAMERSLPPEEFVRVHRGAIVNVARIREIQPWFHGEYVVLLHDGARVRTSRGYRARLDALLE